MAEENSQLDEEGLLRSAALKTAATVLQARQRAAEELARAKNALEARTVELERALQDKHIQLEITQVLAQAKTIDEVIHPVLEILRQNLSCACAQLWRVDRPAGLLRRSAGAFDPKMSESDREALASFDSLDLGVGLPGRIWESQRPVWIEDVEKDGHFLRRSLTHSLGLRSAFGFPLIVSRAVSGVIELFYREPRPVDESILEMTATVGSHIGEFIERGAAEAEKGRAFEQLRRLQQVTETALANPTLEKLLANVPAKICEAVGTDIALVFLFDETKNDLYVAAAAGSDLGQLPSLRLPVGESLAGRVAAERRLMIARKATQDPTIREALRDLGVETVVGVPLLSRSRLVGVLKLGSYSDREFTTADTDFMEIVGHQVAMAIENSSLYEAAREANRAKDRFLSIASHELKTPLNALLGWAEVFKTIDNQALRGQALEAIENNVRMQADLITALLDTTRIREGKLVLEHEDVDLPSIVGDAIEAVQGLADKKGLKLVAHLPEGASATVRADPTRVRQVVWNLLTNAIKFTPSGKAISVSVHVDSPSASITVEDEGDGISQDFLPRIFDELQQEEKGARAGGLGLGLYIASTIVKLHGGTITAHSDGPGRGAKFVVRLPVARAAPVAALAVEGS